MSSANPKHVIETYLRLSLHKNENASSLRELLAHDFSYESPVTSCEGVDQFIDDSWQYRIKPRTVEIKRFLWAEQEACVSYDLESADPHTGTLSVTDWITFQDGRIQSIRSNFDATRLTKDAFQI